MKEAEHIFFDLDRTLFDFDKSAEETFFYLYNKYLTDKKGIPVFEEFYKNYKIHNEHLWSLYRVGKISKEHLKYHRIRLSLSAYNIDDEALIKSIADEYVSAGPLRSYLFPHALEILKYLNSKYRIHILTNGFSEVQYKKAKISGISDYITHFITSEEAGCNKPDIRIFEYAMQKAGSRPDNSVMVGDDADVDIGGARRAGMMTVYFNPTTERSSEIADYEIASLRELEEIF